jgi:FKBP12-rapamycin complex-associated protein
VCEAQHPEEGLDDRTHGPVTLLPPFSLPQAYGRELSEAHDWCNKFRRSKREADLNQAWDLYYHVFKRINKQLPHLTTLDLGYVSPLLVSARNLELAVPGTYIAGETLVTIASFAQKLQVRSREHPTSCMCVKRPPLWDAPNPSSQRTNRRLTIDEASLQVITSKQRPRKLNINGGDLSMYGFLLKGHEDLRQDERVMQVFLTL